MNDATFAAMLQNMGVSLSGAKEMVQQAKEALRRAAEAPAPDFAEVRDAYEAGCSLPYGGLEAAKVTAAHVRHGLGLVSKGVAANTVVTYYPMHGVYLHAPPGGVRRFLCAAGGAEEDGRTPVERAEYEESLLTHKFAALVADPRVAELGDGKFLAHRANDAMDAALLAELLTLRTDGAAEDVVAAARGWALKYMKHALRHANCYLLRVQDVYALVTRRRVEAGEELTVPYLSSYWLHRQFASSSHLDRVVGLEMSDTELSGLIAMYTSVSRATASALQEDAEAQP